MRVRTSAAVAVAVARGATALCMFFVGRLDAALLLEDANASNFATADHFISQPTILGVGGGEATLPA